MLSAGLSGERDGDWVSLLAKGEWRVCGAVTGVGGRGRDGLPPGVAGCVSLREQGSVLRR